MARARSRLGDGGPLGHLSGPRGRPSGRAVHHGVDGRVPGVRTVDHRLGRAVDGDPVNTVRRPASAITSSGDRPSARSSRTPVSPVDFESLLPSGLRTSGWWANAGGNARPSARPSRICAAVASSRSSPLTTRSTPWRMSSMTTQNAYVQLPCRSRTGRSPFAAMSPWRSPTMRSVHDSAPSPSAARTTGPPTRRSRQSPGQPGPDHGRPCSASHRAYVDRVQSHP